MFCTTCGEYFLPDRDYLRHIGSCPHCDQPTLILIAYDPALRDTTHPKENPTP
ncbi:hypothetical protein SAMN00768000_3611 [Sulfobacillus thermosulfidooxidans DSM 9293]|uniref:C2H2-type domain-containing protein n=1 Tax=Sulfobacillus thermosulfidooxidans (strain DSM 9293 / VKM B-1269 / AT-1) TaxID=929705 RepID=A0A1W1WPV0_SULTA|nr:hypothetical protein SAMN00768000_3611 [Sulfobacillus thermosulfidooxidans DSM 9293]